jgi:acetyl esterase/lipase
MCARAPPTGQMVTRLHLKPISRPAVFFSAALRRLFKQKSPARFFTAARFIASAVVEQVASVVLVGLPALAAVKTGLQMRSERVKLSDAASVDVYLPAAELQQATEQPRPPVVLFIHGGAWG